MSVFTRARSRERKPDTEELQIQVQEEKQNQLVTVKQQNIPHELLASLTSTVCNRSTEGHTAHHRHCQDFGIRPPDAVWHHPLGRNKYRYFLEQPTSLTGAGRDISFLCDALVTQRKTTPLPPVNEKNNIENLSISENVVPEEYHVVRNRGIRSLEFYEDAFTVQLKDQEQKLRVLPSLRPSGRLEVVQLMKMMDDMLEKAGVDQQSGELTALCQLEGLLELVKVEQNIYNTVFHEVIRQVTVGCAERGQLLARLRQRYQSLLDRIPQQLKGLHTEAVAQRALDRRLIEEIYRIKASIQQINRELSKITEHDVFVSQQVEHADQELSKALKQTHSISDVVQGYHELYELHRGRLEGQLLQMTEERDFWWQFTLRFAVKVIRVKKLHLVNQLHVSEKTWFKAAEHFLTYLSSKDTEDLNDVMELSDCWTEQLLALMSQLKETEHAQCAQIITTHQGITKWFSLLKCPDLKYDETTVEELHADLSQWSDMLAVQFEEHENKKQLLCQQKLTELSQVQEKWMFTSLQLYERHFYQDAEVSDDQQALNKLDQVLSELLQQLDIQVREDSGRRRPIMSLVELMEPWANKAAAAIEQSNGMSVSDWLQLEEALSEWQSLTEEALLHFTEQKDKNKLDIQTKKVLGDLQDFTRSLSDVTEKDNQKLREKVTSFHMAQTRWMLDVLLVMLPDQSEEQNQVQEPDNMTNISLQTLDEDAKTLCEKLTDFSSYLTRSYVLILEEKMRLDFYEAESESEMSECKTLQRESVNWVETCKILLTGVHGDLVELHGSHDSTATQANKESLSEPTPDDVRDETESREGALTGSLRPLVKLISFDGNISQRRLGENRVQLTGTDELLVSPVTEEDQKASSHLTTVVILQQDLKETEARAKSAEQRALKAEEALQAALEKIQDLERTRESIET